MNAYKTAFDGEKSILMELLDILTIQKPKIKRISKQQQKKTSIIFNFRMKITSSEKIF
mgnify:CR=1 FL=1